MKCILDNRATGKTTKLVNEMLKWKNSILLVHCHDFAKVIEERFPKSKGRVFSWNTYIKHKNNKKLIFIDNAEYFLEQMLGNVHTITMNKEQLPG